MTEGQTETIEPPRPVRCTFTIDGEDAMCYNGAGTDGLCQYHSVAVALDTLSALAKE